MLSQLYRWVKKLQPYNLHGFYWSSTGLVIQQAGLLSLQHQILWISLTLTPSKRQYPWALQHFLPVFGNQINPIFVLLYSFFKGWLKNISLTYFTDENSLPFCVGYNILVWLNNCVASYEGRVCLKKIFFCSAKLLSLTFLGKLVLE